MPKSESDVFVLDYMEDEQLDPTTSSDARL